MITLQIVVAVVICGVYAVVALPSFVGVYRDLRDYIRSRRAP